VSTRRWRSFFIMGGGLSLGTSPQLAGPPGLYDVAR
jgi:hypothetical protein